MLARFLLGPAGSGKTFRCLAEIRAELSKNPDGAPLVLLAPKQATFQLERQLIGDSSLHGYARLKILSFDRLARLVFNELGAVPSLLTEEGRVMVLRALLFQCAPKLKRFEKSARRAGFAQQLSGMLAELQSHGVSPAKLAELAAQKHLPEELRAKLHDLGVLLKAYHQWLAQHQLHDAGYLLEAATSSLRTNAQHLNFKIAALWLDGFAEMTPAELDLLGAVLPFCERATLAFCLDDESGHHDALSLWRVVGKTFMRCRQRVEALPEIKIEIEKLARDESRSRFASNPALAHLESHWASPQSFTPDAAHTTLPRIVKCADPAAEAEFAAREILKFVRAGGRFRETAVLVRSLDGYQKPIERAFQRFGIPFFLDRRASVAHHPLAELTRSALRTIASDWRHDDWFAALKAGFAPVPETEIDTLENEALARGWRGSKWREKIQLGEKETSLANRLENIRKQIVPPYVQLAKRISDANFKPTGKQIASALREFWDAVGVEKTLEKWSAGAPQSSVAENLSEITAQNAVHLTVLTQMEEWLKNIERAFPDDPMPLPEWLPVLDAGLANLTVGVIPPALDQVLIGAIDRSRNPDLKLAFVLSVNERVFPAAPTAPMILNEDDRVQLAGTGVELGHDLRDRLARERYFGYIACTRSSERIVLTFSRCDAEGTELSPSVFIAHLQRLFQIQVEEFHHADWPEAEHVSELTKPLIATRTASTMSDNWTKLRKISAVAEMDSALAALRNPNLNERLSPKIAETIYGRVLKSSVSRLEEFAKCPFRFFIHSGLRADERKVFELDFRERGSFQHDVLKIFHEQIPQGKSWRDFTPQEARERIGRTAEDLRKHYRDGLLNDSPQAQFAARMMTRALQDFIEVIVDWMRTRYRFNPKYAELGFGDDDELPAWRIDVGGGRELQLRGRIDRVDLFAEEGSDAALCVVMDYKSSTKKLDPVLLANGVQLQLLSYLGVLRNCANSETVFGVKNLKPAGVFYVSLRAKVPSEKSRAGLEKVESSRKEAYQHTGRFDFEALKYLDSSGGDGEQFNFRLRNDGQPHASCKEALNAKDFAALLTQVEKQLTDMGARIFSGEAEVKPYRKGAETPCGYCDYKTICRIDPWKHEFRKLAAEKFEATVAESD